MKCSKNISSLFLGITYFDQIFFVKSVFREPEVAARGAQNRKFLT